MREAPVGLLAAPSAALAVVAVITVGACASPTVAVPAASTVALSDEALSTAELVPGLDPFGLFSAAAPKAWTPDLSLPLREALPSTWPADYGQDFSPYSFRQSAAYLCAYRRAHPDDPDATELAHRLVDRLVEYTVVDHGARFVVYTFLHAYEDIVLQPGWTSAFGNGEAIMGLLVLESCAHEERLMPMARELAAAFWRTESDGPWFTRELGPDEVWFEEVPVADRPEMILNGHLASIVALYYLWSLDGRSERLEALAAAGIRAVLPRLELFRRTGDVLCYDLSPPCHADYGPERTIRFIVAVGAISGDPSFDRWRDALAADVRLDPTAWGPTPTMPEPAVSITE